MFLTLEDPRAAVQGSVDPLRQLPVWSWYGRHLVANLTTVSNSLRGFTILLLGRYYGLRLAEDGKLDEDNAVAAFECIEQLGAYARHIGHGVEGDIRGIERVKRFLEEGGGTVTIAADPRGFILSDQKTYGLWGLYTVPATTTGWLPRDRSIGLSPDARAFIESEYVPALRRSEDQLLKYAAIGGSLDTKVRTGAFRAVVQVLEPDVSTAERDFYGDWLRDGNHVGSHEVIVPGRQATVRELVEQHTALDGWIDRAEVETLTKAAERRDKGLAERLKRVGRLEALFAPAEALFYYVLANDGRDPHEVAQAVRDTWGTDVPHLDSMPFDALYDEIVDRVGPPQADQARRTDAALAAADYDEAIAGLLDWNRVVMEERRAGPWVQVRDGRIDVRYRGGERELPGGDDLPSLWRNSYFLDSLKDIIRAVNGES